MLRLIFLLLIAVVVLLYQIRRDVYAIQAPTTCGNDRYSPCSVVIQTNF